MIEFTPTARERFDDYMRRLHFILGGGRSVEAQDVEQSVREHIEVALADAPSPVPADRLVAVLDRLGDPERWAAGEQPLWRRVLLRLRSGPEDWRLAYLSFGLFVVSLVLFPLMLISFLVSRAYIELMEERNEPLGARRWLVYPPIALLLVIGVAAFVAGPAAPVVGWGFDDHGFVRIAEEFVRGPFNPMQFAVGMAAAIFGAWWVIGSLVLMIVLRPVRFIFAPLLERLGRKHIAVLTGIGVVVFGVGLLILSPYLPFVY